MQHNEILIHAVLFVLTTIHATECLQSAASQGAKPIFPKLEQWLFVENTGSNENHTAEYKIE